MLVSLIYAGLALQNANPAAPELLPAPTYEMPSDAWCSFVEISPASASALSGQPAGSGHFYVVAIPIFANAPIDAAARPAIYRHTTFSTYFDPAVGDLVINTVQMGHFTGNKEPVPMVIETASPIRSISCEAGAVE